MNKFLPWLTNPPPDGPKSTLVLRLMAGGVFFWEGILKFVYANQEVGRFAKLGIPFPHFTAAFIGCLEIFGGLLLLTGLTTRPIAIPFIGEMIVAIFSTKISLYLGTSPLPLPPALPTVGFWAVLHEIRSDYTQILTVIFLLVNGPGKWSLHAVLLRKSKQRGVSKRIPSGRSPGLAAAAHY
jgi:putative oxidoreductase